MDNVTFGALLHELIDAAHKRGVYLMRCSQYSDEGGARLIAAEDGYEAQDKRVHELTERVMTARGV